MTPTTKLKNFYLTLAEQLKMKSTIVDGTISEELACQGKGIIMGYYFSRLTPTENLEVAYFHNNKAARIMIVGNSKDEMFDYTAKDPATKEYVMTQINPAKLSDKISEAYKTLKNKK